MAAVLRLTLALLIAVHGVQAQAPPDLAIMAPAGLAAARNRLEGFNRLPLAGIVRTVGLDEPGPPIQVVLAGEDSEAARASSAWIAGYALGNAGLVVLFPARSPVYPHDTLEDVLRHEVAHVLIARAAGGREVPRWFHEGLAVAVERPWDLEDRSRLVWELVAGPRWRLREVDAMFEAGQAAQSRAYILSAAFVRDFIREHGAGAPAAILRLVREDVPFDRAVITVAGRTLNGVEDEFWNRQRVWTMWVPFFTSGNAFWLLVIGVATLAVWARRRRRAETRRRWDEEERAAAERGGGNPLGLPDEAHCRDQGLGAAWSQRRTAMCQRVQCAKCGKPTWVGCGLHVEQVLGDVPKGQRCQCPRPTSLWRRLFGR